MTKQIPYDLIPASDLPRSTPGAFDSVVGVDESTGSARRFPMPSAGAPRAYETRADLPASAQPGTAAYVNNDPTAENNGLWAFLDGAWVKSADRFTGMEGRLVTAEQDVAGLKDFRVEARTAFDNTAHEILDLRDRVPDDAAGYVWGVADRDGRALIGADAEGLVHARLKDPFMGHEAPADEGIAAITDGEGRELVSWDPDGTLRAKLPDEVAPQIEPLLDASDTLAFAVTDADGRLLYGVARDGQFVAHGLSTAPGQQDLDVPDVEGGDVYLTGASGRELLASGSKWPFIAAESAPKGFRASQARPLVGTHRRVAGSRDGLLIPDSQRLLTHFVGFGQSLSMGAKGVPVVSTYNDFPEHVLMYEGHDVRGGTDGSDNTFLLDPDALTGFEPLMGRLYAPGTTKGQTHLESIGEGIALAASDRVGTVPRMLFSTYGIGATPYSMLKKGTPPYTNILTAAAKTKQLAEDRGWAYWVPAVCFQHGEGNASSVDYFDMLAELQQDLDADIRAITGQAAPVHFYMGQTSTFQGPNTRHSNQGIYRAAKELDTYTIVCPQYAFPYDDDLLHMSGPGYYRLGEYYTKAILAEQFGNGVWTPLRPSEVAWDGGLNIDIEFHVPVEPLVFDTALVDDPGNYGFEFTDDGNTAAVSSVSLLDARTVRVTLSATPTGGNKLIKYAMDGYGGVRVAGEGPRGCLRDSDSTPSRIGGPLYNWCLHFEEPVE